MRFGLSGEVQMPCRPQSQAAAPTLYAACEVGWDSCQAELAGSSVKPALAKALPSADPEKSLCCKEHPTITRTLSS